MSRFSFWKNCKSAPTSQFSSQLSRRPILVSPRSEKQTNFSYTMCYMSFICTTTSTRSTSSECSQYSGGTPQTGRPESPFRRASWSSSSRCCQRPSIRNITGSAGTWTARRSCSRGSSHRRYLPLIFSISEASRGSFPKTASFHSCSTISGTKPKSKREGCRYIMSSSS